MANPGKPMHVKEKIGSRAIALPVIVEQKPLGDLPEPPRRLEESGMALWREAWQHGWLSRVADITAVSLLCERLDERDLLRAYVLDNPDAWRERASLRKLEEQIESSLKSLLLNPVERIKAGVAEAKAQSKLEQLLAAKADRG